MKSFIESIAKLGDSINSNKKESGQTKLHKPNAFDSSDPKKLCGFFLQCKLDFSTKPEVFSGDLAKVDYSLSFLKGMALNYFEPYLMDNPDNEPDWLSDYVRTCAWSGNGTPPCMTLVILRLVIPVSLSPIHDPDPTVPDPRDPLVYKTLARYMYISSDINLTINSYSSSLSLMFCLARLLEDKDMNNKMVQCIN
jgi:hypothetical protein